MLYLQQLGLEVRHDLYKPKHSVWEIGKILRGINPIELEHTWEMARICAFLAIHKPNIGPIEWRHPREVRRFRGKDAGLAHRRGQRAASQTHVGDTKQGKAIGLLHKCMLVIRNRS